MEVETFPRGVSMAPPQGFQKGQVLSRNDETWESLKQEIQRVYMKENNTLPQTMLKIEQAHSFKASPRKWKDKLKEWGFEKNLSEGDMKIVAAKVDKRKRAGKETDVFVNGVQMPASKIDNFKRRKNVRETDPASPSASTPGPITYNTPRFDLDIGSISEVDEAIELNNTFANLEFSAQASSDILQPVDMNFLDNDGSTLDNSQTASELLLSLESQHSWNNILVFNALNESPIRVTENVSMSDFADGVESESISDVPSQLPTTEERNRVADEHDGNNKHDQTRSIDTPELHGALQQTVEVLEGESSVVYGKDLAANAAPTKPSPQTPEERNLVMLGKAIDECFTKGSVLDLTLAQVLSVLTYLQGPALDEEQHFEYESYWETKRIASLAREYIEMQSDSAAVSIYSRVIAQATVVFGGTPPQWFMHRLEKTMPFSRVVSGEHYLKHETVVLQLVLACYFKFELARDTALVSSSRRILGVVQRLRYIQTTRLSVEVEGKILEQRLQDLLNGLRFSLSTGLDTGVLFRHELFFHAMNLAESYSKCGELEIAETIFHLRHLPLDFDSRLMTSSNISYPRATELYDMHQYRRYQLKYKLLAPRIRPWTSEKSPVLTTHSRENLDYVDSQNPAELDLQIKRFCQKLLIDGS